jgi:hypothetical protein
MNWLLFPKILLIAGEACEICSDPHSTQPEAQIKRAIFNYRLRGIRFLCRLRLRLLGIIITHRSTEN